MASTDPPQLLADPDAEQAVLGGILLSPQEMLQAIAGILQAEDFCHPAHAVIFQAMQELEARKEPIDVLTLAAELRRHDRLNAVGGIQFLGSLTDMFVAPGSLVAHAKLVQSWAVRRRTHRALLDAAHRIQQGEPLDATRTTLTKVFEQAEPASHTGYVHTDLESLFDTVLARASKRERPLATPWPAFDQLLGGLWPGMYILVGGTGSGKTQFAVQAAVHAALAGAKVLYVALELSRQDLAARVVGSIAHIPWSKLLRGSVTPDVVHSILRSTEQTLRNLPLFTECGPPYGYSIETFANRAWSLKPALVVLDYLQLCSSGSREDPRITVGRVAYVARLLARDLGAAVLVLSSTARTNYTELVCDPTKDPAELVGLGKESGEIEYAADGVFVLAKRKDTPDRRLLVVAKNRHGSLGKIELLWEGTEFIDLSRSDQAPVRL